MAQSIPNLWPDDIAVSNDLKTPVTILRQQATLLGEKTQNLVVAEVSTTVEELSAGGNRFMHRFNVVAPALGNYRFCIFRVEHTIDFYPIKISVYSPKKGQPDITVKSEGEFAQALKEIFSSEEARRVIHALIAQSQA